MSFNRPSRPVVTLSIIEAACTASTAVTTIKYEFYFIFGDMWTVSHIPVYSVCLVYSKRTKYV